MSRSSSEARQQIDELEAPFIAPPSAGSYSNAARDRIRELSNIVFTRHDYRDDVSQMLDNKVSVGPYLLRVYNNALVAMMRNDLRIHLEPKGALKRQETAADRLEVAESHILLELDPFGMMRESIHSHQARQLWWSGWLEEEKYRAVEQAPGEEDGDYAERGRQHRESHFGWKILEKPPDTVAFMEGRQGKLTLASCRYKLPIIDFLERYSGKSRNDMDGLQQALDGDYGFLKAGLAQSDIGNRDAWRQEVEVCVMADSEKIWHYSQYPNSGRSEYEEIEETDNPFGQVPLLLCEGVYNSGEPIAYRREPLLLAEINVQDALAIIRSSWASVAASPAWPTEQFPAEVLAKAVEAGNTQVIDDWLKQSTELVVDPVTKRPKTLKTYGTTKFLRQEIDPSMDKLYSELKEDAQVASPQGLLSDPEANERLPSSTATVVLGQLAEKYKQLGGAQTSETNMMSRVLDMVEHSMKQRNDHRKRGEGKRESDWAYSFTATGKEYVKGKKGQRGDVFEISPQDLDGDYTRTIDQVDNSIPAVQARGMEADRRFAAGTILWDDYLEEQGIEDVTKFNKDKTEEQLVQVNAYRVVEAARLRAAQFTAAMAGTTVEQVLMGLPQETVPQIVSAGAGPGAGAASGGEVRMGAPSIPSTQPGSPTPAGTVQ